MRYARANNPLLGFTLVEILVAVAIASALAGLIFGAFAGVRERARQTSCTSKLKQIWTAISIYRSDYDGLDPAPAQRMSFSQMGLPTGIPSVQSFYGPLYKQIGKFCPSYHYNAIGGNPSSSYFPMFDLIDGPEDPSWYFLGSRHGLYYCNQHNPIVNLGDLKTWDEYRWLMVRLNGQLSNIVTVAKHDDPNNL